MHVLALSRTLVDLDSRTASTSSQLFEIDLITSLRRLCEVTVVSLAMATGSPRDGEVIRCHTIPRLFACLRAHARTCSQEGRRCVVLIYGYDLRLLLVLNALRVLTRLRHVCFVFDHHGPAIERHPWPRRLALECYFRLGALCLRASDGVIGVNSRLDTVFSLGSVPNLITRVGASTTTALTPYERGAGTFRVLYAGTTQRLNGLDLLLEAARELAEESDIHVDVCGSGDLDPLVAASAAGSEGITWRGLLNHGDILGLMEQADLVVALRDPSSTAARVAFPSKILEAMAMGRPVLTNTFTTDIPLDELAFAAPAFTSADVASEIRRAIRSPDDAESKARLAQMYVRTQHSWDAVAAEVHQFVSAGQGKATRPTRC